MKLWLAAAGGLGIILAGVGLFFLFRWYLTEGLKASRII